MIRPMFQSGAALGRIWARAVRFRGMSLHVRHNPNGTLQVGGDAYRVTERGESYEVQRDGDGAHVGSFVLERKRGNRWDAHVQEAEGASEKVVEAIAKAWVEPRSPLPLQ